MKSIRKKFCGAVVIYLVLMISVFAFAGTAHAASTPQMRQASVAWTLKKGKTVPFYTAYAGIGSGKVSGTVTALKIKDSYRKGYKEADITVRFVFNKYTRAQVKKMRKAASGSRNIGGDVWMTVTDYDSGKYLGKGNKKNVTVWWGDTEYTNSYYYHDNDYYAGGEGIDAYLGELVLPKIAVQRVKIIYPKNYTGLCVGIGGNTQLTSTSSDRSFWNGNTSFVKTSLWNKSVTKRIAYFMRVK